MEYVRSYPALSSDHEKNYTRIIAFKFTRKSKAKTYSSYCGNVGVNTV
jgi:hypothetical protein